MCQKDLSLNESLIVTVLEFPEKSDLKLLFISLLLAKDVFDANESF
jgi:hypothetical protein